MNNKVFLGGTCSETFKTDYRYNLIPLLEENHIEYFNPYVDNWNDEAIEIEEFEKENCALELYVLLSAQMRGVYSIYEMTKCAIEKKGRCLIILDTTGDKNKDRMRSLHKTVEQLEKIGAQISYQNFDMYDDEGEYIFISEPEFQDSNYLHCICRALGWIKTGRNIFTGRKIKLNNPLHNYSITPHLTVHLHGLHKDRDATVTINIYKNDEIYIESMSYGMYGKLNNHLDSDSVWDIVKSKGYSTSIRSLEYGKKIFSVLVDHVNSLSFGELNIDENSIRKDSIVYTEIVKLKEYLFNPPTVKFYEK